MSKMKNQAIALKAITQDIHVPILIQQKASLYAFGIVLLPHTDKATRKTLHKDLRTIKKQVVRICGDDQLILLNVSNVMMAYEGAKLESAEALNALLLDFAETFRKGVMNVLGRKLK